MKFEMVHMNINTMDLEKSDRFYRSIRFKKKKRRKEAADGSYISSLLC